MTKLFSKYLYVCLPAVFLLTSVATTVNAQTSGGSIAGSISDPSGAVIPNATIEATNQQTNVKSTTTSSGAGVFKFPNLALGPYSVVVSAAGFATQKSTN